MKNNLIPIIILFSMISITMTTAEESPIPGFVIVPGGEYMMGDHAGLGGEDPNHPSDEVPVHKVSLDSFYMGTYEVTNEEYCAYLNSSYSKKEIEVKQGVVYLVSGTDTLSKTVDASEYSRITFDGNIFTILDNMKNHPVTDVRWFGVATYCNWLSTENGYSSCFDPTTWACDFSKDGFRIPTEAEWEYAGRGGQHDPYRIFPWGDYKNEDGTYANWEESGDPYETNDYPCTTPVGFYNGEEHQKTDFGWPGNQQSYQTSDGSNPYGLHDMCGNVWEWVYDWYVKDYYGDSPLENPRGPDEGQKMKDGKPYRILRGGNWYNGKQHWGHGRVANRDPGYYRGPQDPVHPYYHVGCRIVKNPELQTGIEKCLNKSNIENPVTVLHLRNNTNRKVTIRFFNFKAEHTQLRIFNAAGQVIRTLKNIDCDVGWHQVSWNGSNYKNVKVANGIYICQLKTGGIKKAIAVHLNN